MRTRYPTLTPKELAIMKVVWALNEATVRQIYDALLDRRPIAYTTVMTVMRIRDFLDRVFDGAPDELILHLAKADLLTETRTQVVRRLTEGVEE